jgi:hypothetical protein
VAVQELLAHDFPDGTVVKAYPRENLPPGGTVPTGTAVDTGTVAGGVLAFEGLTEGRRYVAWALGRQVSFFAEPGSLDQMRPIRGDEAADIREKISNLPVSVLDTVDGHAGAQGDGITNDDAAFARALELAERRGAALSIPRPPVAYRLTSTLSPDVPVIGDGAEIWQAADVPMFTFEGAEGASTALTLNVAAGAAQLQVASTAALEVGAQVRIKTLTAYVTPDDPTDDAYYGEIAVVKSIDDGTHFTIAGHLGRAYTTAETTTVVAVDTVQAPVCKGLTFRKLAGLTVTNPMVRFRFCRDPELDIVGHDHDVAVVQLRSVIGGRGRLAAFNGGAALGYGYELRDGTRGFFGEVTMRGGRHAATTGVSSGNIVVGPNTIVADATDCSSGGVDCHDAAIGMTYIAQTSRCATAATIRGENTTLIIHSKDDSRGVRVFGAGAGSHVEGTIENCVGGTSTGQPFYILSDDCTLDVTVRGADSEAWIDANRCNVRARMTNVGRGDVTKRAIQLLSGTGHRIDLIADGCDQGLRQEAGSTFIEAKIRGTATEAYNRGSGATAGRVDIVGNGSPEGVVSGAVGSQYLQLDGGVGTVLWVKESAAAATTGWDAK